jgi:hypothetical protein
MGRLSIAIPGLGTVMGRLSIAIPGLGMAMDRLSIAIPRLGKVMDSVSIAIDTRSTAMDRLAIPIDNLSPSRPPSGDGHPVKLRLQNPGEGVDLDGLRQVMREATFECPCTVLLARIPADCNDADLLAAGQPSHALCDLVTVHPGQTDVEKHRVRLEGRAHAHRRGTVVSHTNLVPTIREK